MTTILASTAETQMNDTIGSTFIQFLAYFIGIINWILENPFVFLIIIVSIIGMILIMVFLNWFNRMTEGWGDIFG